MKIQPLLLRRSIWEAELAELETQRNEIQMQLNALQARMIDLTSLIAGVNVLESNPDEYAQILQEIENSSESV